MNRSMLSLSLALLALAACVDTTLKASDYNKKCTADDECVDVFIGDACDACHCSNDAINVSDLNRYKDDLNAATTCRSGGPVCAADCVTRMPICQQGTCALPMN